MNELNGLCTVTCLGFFLTFAPHKGPCRILVMSVPNGVVEQEATPQALTCRKQAHLEEIPRLAVRGVGLYKHIAEILLAFLARNVGHSSSLHMVQESR